MKEFFLKMLNSVDPSVSSTRFLSVTTVLTVLYVWMWVSIYTHVMQDIPSGVCAFVGIVITGGAVRGFSENENKNNTTTEVNNESAK